MSKHGRTSKTNFCSITAKGQRGMWIYLLFLIFKSPKISFLGFSEFWRLSVIRCHSSSTPQQEYTHTYIYIYIYIKHGRVVNENNSPSPYLSGRRKLSRYLNKRDNFILNALTSLYDGNYILLCGLEPVTRFAIVSKSVTFRKLSEQSHHGKSKIPRDLL